MIQICPECGGNDVCYFLKPQSENTAITCQWCNKSASAGTEDKAEIEFLKVEK